MTTKSCSVKREQMLIALAALIQLLACAALWLAH